MTTDRLTLIVIYAHRPKRVRKRKAQAAAIAGPRIVASKKLGPGLRLEGDDPEARTRVRAFLKHDAEPPSAAG